MNGARRDGAALDAIVREFERRMQRAGRRLRLAVYVADDFDGWRIDGHLDVYVREQLRTRSASVDVSARTMMVTLAKGDGAAVEFIEDRIRDLERQLNPSPLPVFRIGTRHHRQRLVLRAA